MNMKCRWVYSQNGWSVPSKKWLIKSGFYSFVKLLTTSFIKRNSLLPFAKENTRFWNYWHGLQTEKCPKTGTTQSWFSKAILTVRDVLLIIDYHLYNICRYTNLRAQWNGTENVFNVPSPWIRVQFSVCCGGACPCLITWPSPIIPCPAYKSLQYKYFKEMLVGKLNNTLSKCKWHY